MTVDITTSEGSCQSVVNLLTYGTTAINIS